MSTLISLLAFGFLIGVGFRLIMMLWEAGKMGLRQAEMLEREFGFDVLGAARYQLGFGGSFSKNGETAHFDKLSAPEAKHPEPVEGCVYPRLSANKDTDNV